MSTKALGLVLIFAGAAYVYLRASSPSNGFNVGGATETPGDPGGLSDIGDLFSGLFGDWSIPGYGDAGSFSSPAEHLDAAGLPADPSEAPSGDPVPDYSGYYQDDSGSSWTPPATDPMGIDPFFPSIGSFTSSGDYSPLIQQAADRYGVRAEIISAIIQKESGGNPTARNPSSSARGLMGMTKGAAQDVGADWNALDDPATAIDAGTAYLAIQINRFGEYDGVRAYYAGGGTISQGTNTSLLSAATAYAASIFA